MVGKMKFDLTTFGTYNYCSPPQLDNDYNDLKSNGTDYQGFIGKLRMSS